MCSHTFHQWHLHQEHTFNWHQCCPLRCYFWEMCLNTGVWLLKCPLEGGDPTLNQNSHVLSGCRAVALAYCDFCLSGASCIEVGHSHTFCSRGVWAALSTRVRNLAEVFPSSLLWVFFNEIRMTRSFGAARILRLKRSSKISLGPFNSDWALSPCFSSSCCVCATDVCVSGQNKKSCTQEVSWQSLDQVVPYGTDFLQWIVYSGEMIMGIFWRVFV